MSDRAGISEAELARRFEALRAREHLPWLVNQKRAAAPASEATVLQQLRREEVRSRKRLRQKRWYRDCRAKGVCPTCTQPAVNGRVYCVPCQAKSTTATLQRRQEQGAEYRRKQRAMRRMYRARGICTDCGAKQPPERVGMWLCVACVAKNVGRQQKKRGPETRQKQAGYTRAMRERRIKAGRCAKCNGPQGRNRLGKHYCLECTAWFNERNRRRRRVVCA